MRNLRYARARPKQSRHPRVVLERVAAVVIAASGREE
jgi:hypothetical protein